LVEGYLRNYVNKQQRTWVRWLHLGEHCYNTTFHMSIGMTPFRALYGYDAPILIDLVFGKSRAPKTKDWITESQEILKLLKENLQTAQNRQKMSVDRHKIECSFDVGDLVFLRLQPIVAGSIPPPTPRLGSALRAVLGRSLPFWELHTPWDIPRA
jgi:hypothetical protein